jgi:O-antigen/teichoic acid export membrane protein
MTSSDATTPVLTPSPETLVLSVPRAALAARVLRLLRGRAFWALADQAVASVSNFVTVVLVARMLPVERYGAFALLWELLMFLGSLHAALVVYPLLIRGARLDADRVRYLATVCVILTLALACPLSATIYAVGAWQHVLLGACAAGALVAFQVHETLRRALLAHFRYSEAIWGDAIGYLGLAGAVFALSRFGVLSAPAVFASMAGTFLLAAGMQALRLRPAGLERGAVRAAAAEFWVLGRWMLASNLTWVFTGIGVQWCLAAFQDLTHVANFQAVANLLRFTNPLIAAIGGLVIPSVARAGARAGMRYALLGGAILLPYFTILFVAPRWSATLFYGPASEYLGHAFEIRIMVVTGAAGYATQMLLAVLAGQGRSKAHFVAQAVNTAASILFVLPAAVLSGWTMSMVAGLGAMLATGATALLMLSFPRRTPR